MSHEIVDWDEESEDIEEKMSSDEPQKTMGGVVLKLGDIIEIFSPSNKEYHEKTFFIDYIDDQTLEILDVTSGFKHTLTMYETGKLTEESITQIHLLSRAPEEGYARQNGLTTGVWINVHFGGEIPTVITGEITNVDEDMIEIITYPDTDMIYLNFEYKGIPKNLQIEKIETREMPKSVKGSLRQIVESSESGVPDSGEVASMSVSDAGEIAIIMPDNPRLDPNFKDIMKDLILNIDDIEFGEEEEIVMRTEVKRSEQRYGIDIQLNDLLDELYSTIPTNKRTNAVNRRIHTIVSRFKELREKFSTFDENGNVIGYNNFDAAYKPLVEHLEAMDCTLRWILPVVKQQTKLYNVVEEFESNDISKKSYIMDVLEMDSKKKLYTDYSGYYDNLDENMTPFERNDGKRVNANIEAIIDNLDNYYTHVCKKVNIERRRFVIQKYNLGLSKMHQHIMKSGKTVYVRGPLTASDKMDVKSVIMLPNSAIEFSRVDLPGTNVLDRVNKSHNWLYYYRMLREKTQTQTISANQTIEEVPGFLEFVTDFDMENRTETNYREFLQNIIPRSRSIINLMRDRIPDPYSFYSIISFFEPFLLYPDNITYSAKTLEDKRANVEITHGGSYQEIRYFVKEMVKKYKASMASKGAEFGNMSSKKYEKEGKMQNAIYRVLKENSEFLKMVQERYSKDDALGSIETLSSLLKTDGGLAYMSTVSLMLGVLFKPDLSRILAMNETDIESSVLKTKSCATRSIAKHYKSVKDMQKDNNTEDVFYDKEYDETPYNIMDKYQEEKGKMLPERFSEYLKMVLIEKHDINPELAEEMAQTLIAGRRRIHTGNYAMLTIVPVAVDKDSLSGVDVSAEENAKKKTSFYVRHKNTWVREDVDDDTFCNISPKCYLNEDAKKKTCDSDTYTAQRLHQKDMKSVQNIEYAIESTTQELSEELKARAKYHLELLKKIRWIKDSTEKQQNIIAYMMGTQVAENTIIQSPYVKLRDYILGQSDFPKRQSDILRFRDHFCREAVISDTVAESEHWFYCVDTNSQLLPKFLYDLAYSYVVGNNYEEMLDTVCRRVGRLSEDQDSIIDRHSGYIIKMIDFIDEEEYNEAGFKVSHADIMMAGAGETLLDVQPVLGRKTHTGKKVFEDINTQHIYNIASTLCEYMGVDFTILEERIMLLSIDFVKNLDSVDAYKVKQEKAAKKNIKIVSYQTYFDQNKLYFTACVTFVAIQTAIPSFTPRKTFPGCIFSFGGYPLEAGEDDNAGVRYMACVIDSVKSTVEPWNSISNQKREVITQRLMELLSKRVLLNEEVANLYLRKKQDMIDNPDLYKIPKDHAVTKWMHYQPPIVDINLKGIQSVTPEFKEELAMALKKGDKVQQEMLGALYAKIIANTYGVIENVNATVAIYGKEALLRAGSIVFLENACCEDEGKDHKKRKAMDFFIDKDANIIKYINEVKSHEEIINDAKHLCTPSYLICPVDKKKMLEMGKQTHKYSEEQIYLAFIHYCKLMVDAPVPDDLQAFYPEKPAMSPMDLPQTIEHLKSSGHNHTQKSLQDLMQTVAVRNKVAVDLTEKKVDYGIMAFVDLIEHLSDKKVIETPLANHIMKLVDLYKEGARDKIDAMNALKRYLMKANKTMLSIIDTYVIEFSSMNKREKTRIGNFLTNIGSWKSQTDAEVMFKSSQFIKDCVHTTTKVVPAMLQNSNNQIGAFTREAIGLFNVEAMKHWELSKIHEDTIVRNIANYYEKLNTYQKDEMVCLFFRDMENTLVNLNLFAEHIPVFEDQNLLFDREIVQMLYVYIYYSVFHDLIVESNNEDYVKLEMAKVKQMRRNMSMTAEEIEFDALFSAEDDEDPRVGDEYNILVGKKQDFKKQICQLLTILIETHMDNKEIINVNYAELSDKIYKANKMEKKTITDRFENMSIEERAVENAMKKYKMGAWNVGEEKGIFIYDKRTYDKEVSGQMIANTANMESVGVEELNAHDDAIADADADREAYDISGLGENYMDGVYYEEDVERDE